MLPRVNRLVSRRLFDQLQSRGIRRMGGYLLIRALPGRTGTAQVAVAMGTRASKLATVRNRHKRVVREAVRTALPQLAPGWSIAITVRRAATTPAEWLALREEVRSMLARPFSG